MLRHQLNGLSYEKVPGQEKQREPDKGGCPKGSH